MNYNAITNYIQFNLRLYARCSVIVYLKRAKMDIIEEKIHVIDQKCKSSSKKLKSSINKNKNP